MTGAGVSWPEPELEEEPEATLEPRVKGGGTLGQSPSAEEGDTIDSGGLVYSFEFVMVRGAGESMPGGRDAEAEELRTAVNEHIY